MCGHIHNFAVFTLDSRLPGHKKVPVWIEVSQQHSINEGSLPPKIGPLGNINFLLPPPTFCRLLQLQTPQKNHRIKSTKVIEVEVVANRFSHNVPVDFQQNLDPFILF